MTALTIGWVAIFLLLFLILIRIPVALAMSAVGFIGYLFISGSGPALKLMGMVPYSTTASYTFTVIPLFLLMGFFIYYGNLATDMFTSFNKWLAHIPGGIVFATIIGGAAFGAANGSGPASTAALAKITIPEMTRLGVNKRLALGTVASAGPLATMIPPSMLMIIYAIIAEQSVGKLLIAGIIPGIIVAFGYVVTVFILLKRNPSLAPKSQKFSLKERMHSLKGVWGVAILISAIIVGLYFGIFTPTEAGAVGATVALMITLISRKINFKGFQLSVLDTIKTTASIFFIIIASFLFGYFLGITQIPNVVATFLVNLDVNPMVIMFFIIFMYLVLGMFIDMVSAMFLTLPIILPAVIQLGFDPIWFGVIVVFLAEISLVTPPFGLSIFIIQSVVKDTEYSEIVKGAIPFIITNLIILLLLVFFPQLVLFLPDLM